MRKQMVGTIAALLAIVLVAGAQTPGTETARAALEKVNVVRGDDGVRVEILEGLADAAKVIVQPPSNLHDGAAVAVMESP